MRLGKMNKCVDFDISHHSFGSEFANSPLSLVEHQLEQKIKTPTRDEWRRLSSVERTKRLLEEVDALEQLKQIVDNRARKRRRDRGKATTAVNNIEEETQTVSLWVRRKRARARRDMHTPPGGRSPKCAVGTEEKQHTGDDITSLRINPPNVNVLLIAQESLVNRCNKLYKRNKLALCDGDVEGITPRSCRSSHAEALDQWLRSTAASKIVGWVRRRRQL